MRPHCLYGPCRLHKHLGALMYKFPATQEKNTLRQDFLPSLGTNGLQVRIIPKREGGLPMQQVQVDALRTELELQNWLDTLMALMKMAGNDTRVRILYLLWRRGEVRVHDLAAILQLTTPAISQQLKKLRNCGLVRARRDAQTIYYRLHSESDFIKSLVGFFSEGTD